MAFFAMGWGRLVGSFKLQVSVAEYSPFLFWKCSLMIWKQVKSDVEQTLADDCSVSKEQYRVAKTHSMP